MRRLLAAVLIVVFPAAVSAQWQDTTRAKLTLGSMFTQSGSFGPPPFAADPFACSAAVTAERSVYYNTVSKTIWFCNGTAWTELGREIAPASRGVELAPIDAACTGWTLGVNWACNGDGTITKTPGATSGPNGLRSTTAVTADADYEITLTVTAGTWAGAPETRPFLVSIGDGPGAKLWANGVWSTIIHTSGTTGLTIGTEASGTGIGATFGISVRRLSGAGTIVEGGLTVRGKLNVEGALEFGDSGYTFYPSGSLISMYFGMGVAKNRLPDLFGNWCVGPYTCANLTGGGDNTMAGSNTGGNISTGSYNTAYGVDAFMRGATTVNFTGIGKAVGWGIIGDENTCGGSLSCYAGTGTAAGIGNAAWGMQTLYSVTSGTKNAVLGWKAGWGVTSGNGHVIIGAEAGYNTGATASTANAVTTAAGGAGPSTYVGYRAGQGSAVQINNSTAIGANSWVSAHGRVALGSSTIVDVMAGSAGQATIESAGERGAHVKVLVDGAAAATVASIPLPVSYSSYESGLIQWSAESTDATDYRQVTGLLVVNAIRKGVTPQCVVDTVPMSAAVNLALSSNGNALTCTWTVAVVGTNCELQGACADDTAGAQTITVRVRPSMTTLSPGNIVWP